ncbi:MAG: MBOAT family protein, partial [Sphingomonadales bacterium]
WITTLAYMAQLYFDFSGYSDMAIGLAGMFGIKFPNNFNSPYKTRSIIDFWQRWHMTLSRYIGLLLYNPVALAITRSRVRRGLKVSRKALAQPATFVSMIAFPTFFAMGIAGVWHGAGMQFLVFGLLHASYLTINHAWRTWGPQHKSGDKPASLVTLLWQVALTQLVVLVAFVFFRADSVDTAVSILASMTGGATAPIGPIGEHAGDLARLAIAFAIIWLVPNTIEVMGDAAPVLEPLAHKGPAWLRWRPSAAWGILTALLLGYCMLNFTNSTEFLYFQF